MKSETKVCSHCKKDLMLSAFGTHKKTAPNGKKYDFRRSVCKECYAKYEVRRRSKYGSTYRYKPYQDWTEAAKQTHKIQAEKHRAKLALLPTGFTRKDWKAALEYFDHKCAYCGDELTKAEQDHFIPASSGGGYTKDNIVPACRNCNSDKRAKNPIDWLSSQVKGLIAYARIMHYFASFQ